MTTPQWDLTLYLVKPQLDRPEISGRRLPDGRVLRLVQIGDPLALCKLLEAELRPNAGAVVIEWDGERVDAWAFITVLRRAGLACPPFYLGVHSAWTRPLAIVAARCGVQAFLGEPIKLPEVLEEVRFLGNNLPAPSGLKLLPKAGRASVDWRGQMSTLTQSLGRSRSDSSAWEDRVKLLTSRLDAVAGGMMAVHEAEALLLYASQDRAQLDLTLSVHGTLTLGLLERCYHVIEVGAGKSLGKRAEAARTARLIQVIVDGVRDRQPRHDYTPQYKLTYELARRVEDDAPRLSEQTETTGIRQFRENIADLLGMSRGFLLSVERSYLLRMATNVVRSKRQVEALTRCRLTILAYVLRTGRSTGNCDGGLDAASVKIIAQKIVESGHDGAQIVEEVQQIHAEMTGSEPGEHAEMSVLRRAVL